MQVSEIKEIYSGSHFLCISLHSAVHVWILIFSLKSSCFDTALMGTLNDRLLLACSMDANPRQKQSVEIKTRLVGLLEPLLIGWATMQQKFESKLDLSEILYQLTSR